jgi:hypothetical protein
VGRSVRGPQVTGCAGDGSGHLEQRFGGIQRQPGRRTVLSLDRDSQRRRFRTNCRSQRSQFSSVSLADHEQR